ncbi:hypothetical protein Acsp04_52080 [Actinomadura sp. NBRC 104425]|nr:hypothetical protein Acsp04_52080 [Actinomadura sp. NBRC 104425]
MDRYAHQHVGAKTIANLLNKRGHRTKNGMPWSRDAVLTVLRNRVYLGEVYFRDHYDSAPHTALVDREVFMAAQEILVARGEDHNKRASNASDYMLTGRVICTHYLGTAATGNKYTYRYCTCYSRNRYGIHSCNAEQLPAEQLDQAVIEALPATYQNVGLFEKAVAAVAERRAERQQIDQKELQVVETEITDAEAGIERYLHAFEAKTLPEDTCGHRVRELADKVAQLRERKIEILDALADVPQTPTENDLAKVRDRIREAVDHGAPAARKALIQSLVHEVHVTGRHHVQPVFRFPSAYFDVGAEKLRELSGSVPPAGFEPATPALGERCSIP